MQYAIRTTPRPTHATAAGGVTATGLGKRFGDLWALRDLDLDVAPGQRARAAGPQRRRQDHRDPDPHHALDPHRGHRRRWPGSTSWPTPTACAGASAWRVAAGHRRRPDERAQEPGHGRAAPRPEQARRHPACRRAARALRPRGVGRPAGEDVLRRHASPARPRGEHRRGARGAVPRRADHGARPAQPQRALGDAPRPDTRTAPRSSSPRSTSKRPTSSPTRSSCSTTAAPSRTAPPTS